jgi:hypothetical protein
MEPIDSTEPTDPIDRIDPTEPTDRIEPAEPIDRIDPRDRIDNTPSRIPESPVATNPIIAYARLVRPIREATWK